MQSTTEITPYTNMDMATKKVTKPSNHTFLGALQTPRLWNWKRRDNLDRPLFHIESFVPTTKKNGDLGASA